MSVSKKFMAAVAAVSLTAMPVLAQGAEAPARASAPVEQTDELLGGATWIVALLAVAAVVAGAIALTDDSSSP